VQFGRDIGGNDTEWLAEVLGDGVVGELRAGPQISFCDKGDWS
jgi:hypothetical protein